LAAAGLARTISSMSRRCLRRRWGAIDDQLVAAVAGRVALLVG
jgi:mRNA-degrading endonuclease toxin of MazEF toxin-antitoxin module